MKEIKDLDRLLTDYARRSGADFAQVFDGWLDWIIGWFDTDRIVKCKCDFKAITAQMEDDNPTFFECFNIVTQMTAQGIEQKGWCDPFGSLYEEKVKSGYKASNMGQFFTPESLCDTMAKLTGNGDGTFVYDPACGSGRLPLAMWGQMDKDRFRYFVLGDIDPMSCKMSAVNMMLHGMFGIVERRDALSMEFFGGYIINEMCYPLPACIPSIRRADEEECRKNADFARSIAPRDS